MKFESLTPPLTSGSTSVLVLKSLFEALDGASKKHKEVAALTGGLLDALLEALLDALGSFLAPANLADDTATLAIKCINRIYRKSTGAAN